MISIMVSFKIELNSIKAFIEDKNWKTFCIRLSFAV